MTTVHLSHEPHGHCHHDVAASECTLCSYIALEKFHDARVTQLIKDHCETTERTEEAGEEGQGAGLDGAPHT